MKSQSLAKKLIALNICLSFWGVAAAANYKCDVVVVGGGAAGVHSLYRLAPILKNNVCLFEVNDYLGGRIKDLPSPNGQGSFGLGALRLQEGQNVMFKLAQELNINLAPEDKVGYSANRVMVKGTNQHSGITDDVNSYLDIQPPLYNTPVPSTVFPDPEEFYPMPGEGYPDQGTDVNCVGENNYPGCYSDAYYHALLNPKYLPAPGQYTDNRTWIIDQLGQDGFQYLTDTFRFRGDFQNQVDPISYRDFLTEDWDICCTPTYPKGGMSVFIKAMSEAAQTNGARIYLSEGITSIGSDNGAQERYTLTTSKGNKVRANSIIIAVPPTGIDKMGSTGKGNNTKDMIAALKATPQYQAITPVRVVSINNWWKVDWWTNLKASDGTRYDRAWSTINALPNTNLYLNFIEMPHSDYQQQQFATRSVYDDDVNSMSFWATLWGAGDAAGQQAVNAEIVRELNLIFPEIQDPSNLGRPLAVSDVSSTAFEDWTGAWYFLKGPTTLTNADIAEWAVEPLPGEKISLVSDAYNPNRTTWVEGAVKSSINSLNYNYSNTNGHSARIQPLINTLECSSIDINGTNPPVYHALNQNGEYNDNCPFEE